MNSQQTLTPLTNAEAELLFGGMLPDIPAPTISVAIATITAASVAAAFKINNIPSRPQR